MPSLPQLIIGGFHFTESRKIPVSDLSKSHFLFKLKYFPKSIPILWGKMEAFLSHPFQRFLPNYNIFSESFSHNNELSILVVETIYKVARKNRTVFNANQANNIGNITLSSIQLLIQSQQ